LTGGKDIRTLPPKNRFAHREIPLSGEVLEALTRQNEHQSAERDSAGGHWTETGLIFTSPTGRPLDPAILLRDLYALCDQAGVPHIRFQQLRYTCAALMLRAGAPLQIIQQFLGYSTNPAHAIPIPIPAHIRLRLQHQAIEQLGNTLHQGTPERDTTPQPPDPGNAAQYGTDVDEPPAAPLTSTR
jgi:integrase